MFIRNKNMITTIGEQNKMFFIFCQKPLSCSYIVMFVTPQIKNFKSSMIIVKTAVMCNFPPYFCKKQQ